MVGGRRRGGARVQAGIVGRPHLAWGELRLQRSPSEWDPARPGGGARPGGEAGAGPARIAGGSRSGGGSSRNSGRGLTHRSADFAFLQRNSPGRICARSLDSACCQSPRSVRTGRGYGGSARGAPGDRRGSGLKRGSRTHLPPLLAGPGLSVKHHHCGWGRKMEGHQAGPHPSAAPTCPLGHTRIPSSPSQPRSLLLGSDLEKVSRSSRFLEKSDRQTDRG